MDGKVGNQTYAALVAAAIPTSYVNPTADISGAIPTIPIETSNGNSEPIDLPTDGNYQAGQLYNHPA